MGLGIHDDGVERNKYVPPGKLLILRHDTARPFRFPGEEVSTEELHGGDLVDDTPENRTQYGA